MKLFKHSIGNLARSAPRPEREPVDLTAVIVYNDVDLAYRAAEACGRIEKDMDGIRIGSVRTVNVHGLSDKSRATVSASEAAQADLVFVCLNPRNRLPEDWQVWFWSWAAFRWRDTGLLACLLPVKSDPLERQLSPFEQDAEALREFFQCIARTSSMELVVCGEEPQLVFEKVDTWAEPEGEVALGTEEFYSSNSSSLETSPR